MYLVVLMAGGGITEKFHFTLISLEKHDCLIFPFQIGFCVYSFIVETIKIPYSVFGPMYEKLVFLKMNFCYKWNNL